MDQQMPKQPKKKMFKWSYIETIFCISAVLVVFVPLLLTRSWGLPSFKDTGDIGDTIGGTTAPFIGLLSAWLVYKALKAQIDANEKIQEQFEKQKKDEKNDKIISFVTEQLNVLREDIKEFRMVESGYSDFDGDNITGSEAIEKILFNYPTCKSTHKTISTYNSKILEIKSFLQTVEYLVDLVIKSEIDGDEKEYLLLNIGRVHNIRLLYAVKRHEKFRMSKKTICDNCKGQHGLPDSLFEINDSIVKKIAVTTRHII